jgi:hypothetical protein
MEKTIRRLIVLSLSDTLSFVMSRPLSFIFTLVTTALLSLLDLSGLAAFFITLIVAYGFFDGKKFVASRLRCRPLTRTLLKSQILTFTAPISVIVSLIWGTIEVEQGKLSGFSLVIREMFTPFLTLMHVDVGQCVNDFFIIITVFALANMFLAGDVHRQWVNAVMAFFKKLFEQAKDWRHLVLCMTWIFFQVMLLGAGTLVADLLLPHVGMTLLFLCLIMTIFKSIGYITLAMYVCRRVFGLHRPTQSLKHTKKWLFALQH